MAEPLKNQFGFDIAERIATQLVEVWPEFDRVSFLNRCRTGYEVLELMPRGQQIAETLAEYLPREYPQAISLLLKTLGPPLQKTSGHGMASFFYLPHTIFVAKHGLEHFVESMQAQYELTQRFTAEFCIRPFLERHTERTLLQLRQWSTSDNVHVRRLVSEGTRPRLPWAPRLRAFQQDPRPVLPLLETLKDDPELYVRRSVANHLNDIGKDHPEMLCEIAQRWLKDATPEREWVVRHALRSLIKQGYPAAFEVLAYTSQNSLHIQSFTLTPSPVRIGQNLSVRVSLKNTMTTPVAAIVDLRIYFCKSNGKLSPKTFKLKDILLEPLKALELKKSISFKAMTTRSHYPGSHEWAVLVNGRECLRKSFEVLPA